MADPTGKIAKRGARKSRSDSDGKEVESMSTRASVARNVIHNTAPNLGAGNEVNELVGSPSNSTTTSKEPVSYS